MQFQLDQNFTFIVALALHISYDGWQEAYSRCGSGLPQKKKNHQKKLPTAWFHIAKGQTGAKGNFFHIYFNQHKETCF